MFAKLFECWINFRKAPNSWSITLHWKLSYCLTGELYKGEPDKNSKKPKLKFFKSPKSWMNFAKASEFLINLAKVPMSPQRTSQRRPSFECKYKCHLWIWKCYPKSPAEKYCWECTLQPIKISYLDINDKIVQPGCCAN